MRNHPSFGSTTIPIQSEKFSRHPNACYTSCCSRSVVADVGFLFVACMFVVIYIRTEDYIETCCFSGMRRWPWPPFEQEVLRPQHRYRYHSSQSGMHHNYSWMVNPPKQMAHRELRTKFSELDFFKQEPIPLKDWEQQFQVSWGSEIRLHSYLQPKASWAPCPHQILQACTTQTRVHWYKHIRKSNTTCFVVCFIFPKRKLNQDIIIFSRYPVLNTVPQHAMCLAA